MKNDVMYVSLGQGIQGTCYKEQLRQSSLTLFYHYDLEYS